LTTALKLEPPLEPEPDRWRDVEPDPDCGPPPEPEMPTSITKTHSDEQYTYWKITLSKLDAATFDAAVQSHLDAAIAEWKRAHVDGGLPAEHRPPFPTKGEAFMRLVESSWDADAARRPHGQRATVVVHLDLTERMANLHLGPLLTDAERQYLSCDATCEVWFERVVPGCGATRGLHAHHIRHWEDGGPTELDNLVLLCPYHHRCHHRGVITITGLAPYVTVTDSNGRTLSNGSLARPPNRPPPDVPRYPGPTGERAHWKWYAPFEPQPPPNNN
jgi:Domain of unknown function (DUF222)/HNH endonuclease